MPDRIDSSRMRDMPGNENWLENFIEKEIETSQNEKKKH